MALNYQGQLLIPTGSAFTNGSYGVLYQQGSGSSGGTSLNELLGYIKTNLETDWGGTFAWTTTTVGGNYQIDITYTNLTIDPTTGEADDLVGLVLIDDIGGIFYSAMSEPCGDCPECPPSVNPEDATDCLSCYQLEADFCETPITVQGLDASEDYTFTIIDNVSGKTYTYAVTTDGNGEADIDTADFPTSLFSPYNSPFTITIKDSTGSPVVLTYGYVNYSCIELTIVNADTI